MSGKGLRRLLIVLFLGLAAASVVMLHKMWPGGKPPEPAGSRRCLLWLPVYAEPNLPGSVFQDYSVEVEINGVSVARLRADSREWPVLPKRVVFDARGKTHFRFRFVSFREEVLCEPEFQADTNPGEMIDFSWSPSEVAVSGLDAWAPGGGQGDPPNAYFPAKKPVRGFAGMWCWLGPANSKPDWFIAQVYDCYPMSDFLKKVQLAGYALRDPVATRRDVVLVRPQGKTLVDSILDLESWEGVRRVYLFVDHVH